MGCRGFSQGKPGLWGPLGEHSPSLDTLIPGLCCSWLLARTVHQLSPMEAEEMLRQACVLRGGAGPPRGAEEGCWASPYSDLGQRGSTLANEQQSRDRPP